MDLASAKLRQDYSIRVHNLAAARASPGRASPQPGASDGDILAPVPQISGRGEAVSPPKDRPRVVNNVIRPFEGRSEEDRRRATQILDYIIGKRRTIAKRQEADGEARMKEEHQALVKQIEEEKKVKGAARRSTFSGTQSASEEEASEELDEFEEDDKYGCILQKDLDRITGGMQVVKEAHIDLDAVERMIAPGADGQARPTQGRLKFLVSQLQKDKQLNKELADQNRNIDNILDSQPYFKNPEHLKAIRTEMLEGSPIRLAKQEVDRLAR